VTEVGGMAELARFSEAIIPVPPRNHNALAAAMERLRHSDDLPRLRRVAEQCYLKHFTVERMATQYMSLYTGRHSDSGTPISGSQIIAPPTFKSVLAGRTAG